MDDHRDAMKAGSRAPGVGRIQFSQWRKIMTAAKRLPAMMVVATLMASASAAENYTIDPRHTFPSLEFSHMGLSIWRGKFNKSSGSVLLDRAARTGSVEVVIDTSSINFGLDAMDEKARSQDFFDVARFPAATYRGTVEFAGDAPGSVDGQVTIMGVSQPVKLTINQFKCMLHPMLKKEVCGADAEGEINWSDYGMKMSQYGKGDAGRVRLRIQVEAIRND
jgi:polyisoprenoid-binding protein YceI